MSYPPSLYLGDSGEVSAHVVRAGIEPATVYPNGNRVLHFAPGAPREAYFEQLAEGIADFDEDAYDRFMREHDNTWV